MARRTRRQSQTPFSEKLVLNQWLLSLFGVEDFRELADVLSDDALEGLDEEGTYRFHLALTARFFNRPELPDELLLEYDRNIVRHTQRLNEKRATNDAGPIVWKYFQYLGLLFSEIYLDRYFSNPDRLLSELNERIFALNNSLVASDQIASFNKHAEAWPQLNKLAFWMAMGSGKTLIMHTNLRQYRHYLRKHGRQDELNRVLLLTINEGLSQQHLKEFRQSDIDAVLFENQGGGLLPGQDGNLVEILEVTRLREEMGEKTVAVDAFEGNNLVFVDEGHRGASSGQEGKWMQHRDALCEKGFSFEYSATFEQAIKGDQHLIDTYSKSTLYDYSYRHFYEDGFGKDYRIFNLDDTTQETHLDLYLVGCLLSFFQQQHLYGEEKAAFQGFGIEKPLWIFVGGRVVKKLSVKDASDIVAILRFLARYVGDRAKSIERIHHVLNQGVINETGTNLFEGCFPHLVERRLTSAQIFDKSLSVIFNASAGGSLYVQNLKRVPGEVALSIGSENEPFGVINVGDDSGLVKVCEKNGFATGDSEFSDSLFQKIRRDDSPVNMLIGSRKFTEGWSSWRVSTMGLMNIGRSEGAQIIQLFGRGVRLKGCKGSLKRSNRAQLPRGIEAPKHLPLMETLGVFGVRANYMAQFRKFLEKDGLHEDEHVELLLPVVKNMGRRKLKTLRLKKKINGITAGSEEAFRTIAPIPTLAPPDSENAADPLARYLMKNPIVVNWYPRVKAIISPGIGGGGSAVRLHEAKLDTCHLTFLDFQWLYFELERFKVERRWHNLNLSQSGVEAVLADSSWYRLQIPEQEFVGDSYEKVQLWEEIALVLLKKYLERYYNFRRREWELPHIEYRDLRADDPNFLGVKESDSDGYRILIKKSQTDIADRLQEFKTAIQNGDLGPWEFEGIKAIQFSQHLYLPLIYLDRQIVKISPAPLNDGEYRFVRHLQSFYRKQPEFFKNRELYLLRNRSVGRGMGFFEAGNFHPDFILWLLEDERQKIIFVDPKGIRNLGWDDPKILFYRTIKRIQARLDDKNVCLESYIVSNTPSEEMRRLWGVDKREMEERQILFQEEDKDSFVESMLIGS